MKTTENSISVLIIEDNPGDQALLEAHLGNTQLAISGITIASTIAEAVVYLQKQFFSLIFLDFFLPDSNGLASYTELARINSTIPVIILSGLSDTALSLKAITLGAQDFLLKGSYDCQSLEKSVWYSIQRKKNSQLLKQTNERYDIISKATNDIIWDWDMLTNKVTWTGQGLKKYLPINTPAAEAPDNFWVTGLHPGERNKVVRSLCNNITSGANSWESDYRFLKNDDTYAHVNSRGYFIKNDAQKPIRMIGSIQDITERKNAELEAEKARREAEEARKIQEQFMANMSHELKTPMNGVIGMTELLQASELNKDQYEYVEIIKESTTNLMAIINDVLDLTKIVAGKIILAKTDYILGDIITNINNLHQHTADEKGVGLICSIDKNIPAILSGDSVRLKQILNNLVGNAVKFTEKGAVNISVKLIREDELSAGIEFCITDTGIGIAEDKVDTIFERFMQVCTDNTRKYGGTGLGLTITRQLIQLLGGFIQVKSRQGEGSIFTFFLTLQKGKLQPCPVKKMIKHEPACIKNALNGVNILLVEDNIISQKVAMKLLTSQGAVVDIANHGKEAIEILKLKRSDIILMDIQMPEMDGYEATKIIRTEMNDTIKTIPIIAMTASSLIADKTKCLLLGMNDFISKPYGPNELFKKILLQLEISVYSNLKCTESIYLH